MTSVWVAELCRVRECRMLKHCSILLISMKLLCLITCSRTERHSRYYPHHLSSFRKASVPRIINREAGATPWRLLLFMFMTSPEGCKETLLHITKYDETANCLPTNQFDPCSNCRPHFGNTSNYILNSRSRPILLQCSYYDSRNVSRSIPRQLPFAREANSHILHVQGT